MKRYIKPNTEIHKIELVQMVAATTPNIVDGDTGDGDYHELGKETEISSGSIWGEEE